MNQCFKTRNNLQFCFTLKLQKCFKKKLKVSSACGRVEDTAFSFWENIYFKMFIILSESTFKNKLAESNSLKSTQSMSTNFMYKHTHTHTLFLAWLLPVGCCRGLGCSLLSHSTHHWKTTIKTGSTLSKVAVPWKGQCVQQWWPPVMWGGTRSSKGVEGIYPIKLLSYSTIGVCWGLNLVKRNCIAVLALPAHRLVSSTNAYQIGWKIRKMLPKALTHKFMFIWNFILSCIMISLTLIRKHTTQRRLLHTLPYSSGEHKKFSNIQKVWNVSAF